MLVEDVFKFWIAARDCVADYHKIGTRFEIAGVKRLRHGNLQPGKKIRHWRVRRRIRAGNAKAALLKHSGQRRHSRAANSDQVNVFVFVLVLHVIRIQRSHSSLSMRGAAYIVTALSKILRLAPLASTDINASTPIGNVMLPDVT